MKRVFGAALVVSALAIAALSPSIRSVAQPRQPAFVHAAPVNPVTVEKGKTTVVTLKITIDKGYHLQGANAKDPYVPTSVTATLPPGVSLGKISYPPSVKKEFTGETLPVYETKIDIKVPLIGGDSMSPGKSSIHFVVNYQGCNTTSCYPPTKLDIPSTLFIK